MSDATTAPEVPPGWQGILEPDERVLWQGRPAGGLRLNALLGANALQGVLIVAFALFWMWKAAQFEVILSLVGVIMLALGLRQILEPVLWPAFRLSRSFYTLTDRRAIIGTDMPLRGRHLFSFPIEAETAFEYVPTEPPSILFGTRPTHRRRREGFEYIADADQVIALMRQIRDARKAEQPDQKDAQP